MERYWAQPPQPRDELMLFSERLDELVERDGLVRLLLEVLEELDWSAFERRYTSKRGNALSAAAVGRLPEPAFPIPNINVQEKKDVPWRRPVAPRPTRAFSSATSIRTCESIHVEKWRAKRAKQSIARVLPE